MELFTFDGAYLGRLRDGDPVTEQHFVSYFEQLLFIKLKARFLALDVVEELCQETLSRVVAAMRREGGIRQPERLGAFVNSVCNNVLLEHYRSFRRDLPLDESHLETPGKVIDLDGWLTSKRLIEQVRRILNELPQRDRDVLCAIFLEEKDKDQVCREFHIDRDYLRVLVHRAKERFKTLYHKARVSPRGGAVIGGGA